MVRDERAGNKVPALRVGRAAQQAELVGEQLGVGWLREIEALERERVESHVGMLVPQLAHDLARCALADERHVARRRCWRRRVLAWNHHVCRLASSLGLLLNNH